MTYLHFHLCYLLHSLRDDARYLTHHIRCV